MKREVITLKGVRTNNLKSIDCSIMHKQLTVISGVSGSGKSSLAFETLYAEGQRRYTESLSTYARQFLQQMERPPVDVVKNIQPAIALRQKNEVSNARSTVGTVTEINDFLELIFTHIGQTYCSCGRVVKRDTVASGVEDIIALGEGTKLIVVASVEAEEEAHRPMILKKLVQDGYQRLWRDGKLEDIDASDIEHLLDAPKFDVVIDRVVVRDAERMRLSEALDHGFALGRGRVALYEPKATTPKLILDRAFRCVCGITHIEPQPALFSFNSSLGACPECSGFGKTVGIDLKKIIPNDTRTLKQGAIVPFESKQYARYKTSLIRHCMKKGIPIDVPYRLLKPEHRRFIERGGTGWSGVRGFFDRLNQKQYKTSVRVFLARYRGYDECQACEGSRLSEDARAVKVLNKQISDFWQMSIRDNIEAFEAVTSTLPEEDKQKVQVLLDEINHRLSYLDTVGLGYLTLDRQSRTLSGGEMQRIHLTTSLGRALTDTLYVLDEPTAGMHAVDSQRLLSVLKQLRDIGNTVVVVEHDPEIIEGADYVIEIGPGGGERGGELIFEGSFEQFQQANTITSSMLQGRKAKTSSRVVGEDGVWIRGARENNLQNIDVFIPSQSLVAVTGVSGSGKSTLLHKVLYNTYRRLKGQGGIEAGAVDRLEGMEQFDDVVLMSQSAVGRSSRSNALSYTKAYDVIRKLFSQTIEAKQIGLSVGDFSFNTKGGRCEHCEGTGKIVIEMHFMPDVEITCPECEGRRFTERVLQVKYKGKNIDDVLNMTIEDALVFFADNKPFQRRIEPLARVGLGYLRLGQSTTTLSGGEAQRLKLATYISAGTSRGKIKPVLFIFDEPTVGLHMADVNLLVDVLHQLVDLGHSVVVIEHNIDFVAACDHLIDLGPGAGPDGGTIMASGHPVDVAKNGEGLTAKYLRDVIDIT